ncbi:MAG: AMP-binding protein [Pontibacterium sp.]
MSAWFQATCRRYGERPAFSCLGASLTYRQLDALSTQFAAYLQGETVLQAGDRIAVHLPNVLQFPVAVFGALKAGLVVVNTNPLYSADELKQQFIDADVKAVVTLANSAYLVEQALPATRIAQVIVTQLADLHPRPRAHWINLQARYLRKIVPHFKIPGAVKFLRCLKRGRERTWQPPEVQPDDLALLQYTGGVTGPSKGVMLSHGNLLANIYQLKSVLDKVCLSGKEIVIAPLPLYHIYSFTLNCLMMLENGAQMVLIINPRDTAGFVKELERWPFTVFSGLSSLFVALCQNQEFTQLDFSRLKVTISGGTALTQATEQLWQQVTGCAIQEGYGLTEGAPVVAVHPPDVQRRPDSAGPAVRLTEAKVIDAEGESLHPGEIGELCVRGPQVMTGYWQRPQETARALVDGWLVTGDMARISEEGYIEVIDRKQEVIYTSGFAVYPGELENIIACHPDVLECVVVGVPDADLGEVVKLFVVSNNRRLTVKTMRDYCRERLTSYKVPRQVEFRHHLPKTHVGKVLRRKLREEEVNKQCKKRRRL